MRATQLIVAIASAAALAACGHGTEERSASGGLSGVVAGAVIAGPIGALAGAAIGGGTGAAVAKSNHEAAPPDDRDIDDRDPGDRRPVDRPVERPNDD